MDEEHGGDSLRERAIKRLEGRHSAPTASEEDRSILIEELSVHQEELKIQNEELRTVKAELETSRAKYFHLYDMAPVGYISLNQDLIVKEANLAATVLLGTDRNIAINRAISTFISPECHEQFYLHYRRLTQGNGIQKNVLAIRREGDDEILVQFDSNLIEDGPEKGYFRTILTDVTDLKRAQQAQKTFSDEVERSNADLQQFAYVASHDLQEPLRMVMSYVALLNKKYGDQLNDEAKMYMANVTEGAERMRQLISELLQYSRTDSQGKEFANVDMDHVANVVINTMHVAIYESKAVLSVQPLPTLWGDEAQLAQVLLNLISNAVKFRGQEPPRVEISAMERAKEWIISVKDNGIGIDPAYHDRIFNMFQRLHSRDEYSGTGIGLAISKKIVERHGGRIWVESELGKGASFFFTIPKRTK
jgi:PAS domain S-box-containing protein